MTPLRPGAGRSRAAWLLGSAAFLVAACVFRDVREQRALMEEACVIEGAAASAAADRRIVVLLVKAAGAASGRPWLVADHFILEGAGRWAFAAPPGEYRPTTSPRRWAR